MDAKVESHLNPPGSFDVSAHPTPTVREEIWQLRGMEMQVPFFALQGYKVWGATALLLSELVAKLRRVGG